MTSVEVLAFGPPPPSPHRRRFLVGTAVGALLLAVVAAAYALQPRQPPDFDLADLQNVYAGMVRADGQNEQYVLEPGRGGGEEVVVSPAQCAPLFDTTTFNQFPARAVDGVSTYWLGDRTTISLFTVRYPSRSVADDAYAAVATAADACEHQWVSLGNERTGPLVRVDPDPSPESDQLGYARATSSEATVAVHVMRFANTVSWQYRLDATNGYSPLPAQQLMDGLLAQMRAVQGAKPSGAGGARPR